MKRAALVPVLMAALSSLLAGCGGDVDLGRRQQPPSSTPDLPAGSTPDDPYLVPSARILELGADHTLNSLAVDGSYLYLAGWLQPDTAALYRCEKQRCQSTFRRLPVDNGILAYLQVYGDRLGVVGIEPPALWIGSFALPDASDRQVALDELPIIDYLPPLFWDGFVYWPMPADSGYYRCALPSCAGGPRKLFDVRSARNATADDTTIFAVADGRIARMKDLGDGAVELLRPDASLSAAPVEPEPDAEQVDELTAGGGMLYGVVNPGRCNSDCQPELVRWPITGGAREQLFRPEGAVTGLSLMGQELMWAEALAGDSERARLTTCRVEACADTLRHLGEVTSGRRGFFAADAERVYWIDEQRVRTVALLPSP